MAARSDATPLVNEPAPPRKWRYSWERVRNTPSVKEGMKSAEELALRRKTSIFIGQVGVELQM